MSKLSEAEKQGLLNGVDSSGNLLWAIFNELAEPLQSKDRSQGEQYLANLLRPQDDTALYVDRSKAGVDTRQKLDDALNWLTLLEIAFELRVLDEADLDPSLLAGFRTLVEQSEAFLRYANAYLYFGARMFASRFFPMDWRHEPLPCDRSDEIPNKRWFPIAAPPTPEPPLASRQGKEHAGERVHAVREGAFADFLQQQRAESFREALKFLDGFAERPVATSSDYADATDQAEVAQYELWLRGLMPPSRSDVESTAVQSDGAEPWVSDEDRVHMQEEAPLQDKARASARLNAQLQDQRFDRITQQLIEWIDVRVAFYSALQEQLERLDLSDDELITNPDAARFALADIYWIARLLRAEVSTNASVSYPRVSWVHILRFKATLDGLTVLEAQLRRGEEVLRSVFNFACDLVQNAVEISEKQERRACNPEAYPKRSQPCTREWREVFDEELIEIDRQRSYRTFIDFDPRPQRTHETYLTLKHPGWSNRMITGQQPHARIGLAFSGGGIRSATFNLGVLQGLQEFDLLRQVDYLSTVSGGGFIGEWLAGNVQRTRHWLGKGTCWDASIDHLRQYASYLAPLTGILSADTWTLAATWIRNTLLVQLSAMVWVFAVLGGILATRKIFVELAHSVPLYATGTAAFAMALVVVGTLIYNFVGNRVETGRSSPTSKVIQSLAVAPSWLGSFLIASNLWRSAQGKMWHAAKEDASYSFILKHAWYPLSAIFAIHFLSMLLIGWFALKPAVPDKYAEAEEKVASLVGPALFANRMAKLARRAAKRASRAREQDAEADYKFAQHVADACSSNRKSITRLLPLRLRLLAIRAHPYRTRLCQSFWIGSLCLAALYLELCGILYAELKWESHAFAFGSYAFVFGPALVLSAFTLSVVLFIGLSGRRSSEAQREWWTRFGAWLCIYAVVGLLLSSFAVLGPKLFILLFQPNLHHHLQAIKWGAVLSGLGTVIGGLFAGNSSKTSGEGSADKSRALELLAKLGGLVFVIGSVIAAASILYLFLLNSGGLKESKDPSYWNGVNEQYWKSLDMVDWSTLGSVIGVLFLVGVLFSYFFEINIFGLSQFYRNRLVRCYLGATRWAPGNRKPHAFTKFDFSDDLLLSDLRNSDIAGKTYRGPFPIFNCTLNLAGSSDLALHTRHSASFSLTPLYCGADRPMVGYGPTGSGLLQDQKSSFAGGVKVGQAVAISGAAASPNMGYNTSPLVALLLTMFNVRLGWWFPNPGRRKWNAPGLSNSLYYLTRELLGIADETQPFLNVSDGGHFENLGVYELVRRRCKVIIACDAECDEVLQFGALGNLVRICATDFGATIEIDVKSIREQKEGFSLAHCTAGLIKYSDGSIGRLIYFKASVTGDEDIGTAQYRSAHPSFPHETTANQFFSEDQFESYRKLGRHVVIRSLRGTQPGESAVRVAEKLTDVTAPARASGDAFLKHTKRLEQMWEQFRRSPALHSFIDELMHIKPPIAVVPPQPANAHEKSEELCMALELMQLMEDVFIDLQLDDFWEHPDNRGWAILFMRWARSTRFQKMWSQTRRTFGIRFEYFCQSRLGLTCDKPIVRV